MNREFWKDKRVFLTGHTGFKGSWLALWLERLGARVVGYALEPPTDPSLFEDARVARGLTSITGDLRDLAALKEAAAAADPEIAIHMAAQSLVRRGLEDPIETYATNVLGTAHLLEALRAARRLRAVVSVTSDKCYRNEEWHWGYRESDALGGRDPYSNSKACAELVTACFRDSYFGRPEAATPRVAVASARSGNVIGGGDWSTDRLVPDLVRGILAGQPVPIRRPRATRPWQHVLEPLRGYLDLAERLWDGGPEFAAAWNLGPAETDQRSVGWLADRIVGLWGPEASWSVDPGEHPPEANLLKLDCSKARARLGWEPHLPLERALEWVVAWYRAWAQRQDMRAVTLGQIEAYEALAPDG